MTQIEIFEQKFGKMINNIPASVDSGAGYVIDEVYKILDSLEDKLPEGLEEAADKYSNENAYMDFSFCVEPIYIGHKTEKAFIAGAEWQAERLLKGSPMPEDTIIFQKGIEEGKRLMMEDAVERTVKIDSGGYPYIDITAELYDYEHDVPLAKEGELVKIIIVKEDKK